MLHNGYVDLRVRFLCKFVEVEVAESVDYFSLRLKKLDFDDELSSSKIEVIKCNLAPEAVVIEIPCRESLIARHVIVYDKAFVIQGYLLFYEQWASSIFNSIEILGTVKVNKRNMKIKFSVHNSKEFWTNKLAWTSNFYLKMFPEFFKFLSILSRLWCLHHHKMAFVHLTLIACTSLTQSR